MLQQLSDPFNLLLCGRGGMNAAHAYVRYVKVTPIKAMFRTDSEDSIRSRFLTQPVRRLERWQKGNGHHPFLMR